VLLTVLLTLIAIAAPGSASAALQIGWTDNASNEDGFQLERKTGPTGTFGLLLQLGPNSVSHTDSTVAAGTTYCYRVRAFNTAGNSAYSNEGCAVAPQGTTALLTISRNGGGTGTVNSNPGGIACGADCTEQFATGTLVNLTAAPAAGSTFTGWSGGGCSGTGGCAVTLSADTTVTASFGLASFTLTVNRTGAGTGTVTSAPAGVNCGGDCSQSYTNGTVVTLTAAPAAGSTFTGWSGGGCSGTGTCVVTVTAATSVTASFGTTGPPAPTRVSMVVRGTDNGIYHNRFDGTRWLGWIALPGMTADTPALASSGGMVELVIRGTDNHVYHNRFNGSGWLGWTSLPGATSDAPAVAVHAGVLNLVVRGTDNAVYHSRFNGQAWAPWSLVPGVATAGSPALATVGGTLHLVVRGLDNGIYHNRFNGSAWLGWTQMAGMTSDDPVVTANGSVLEVAVRGTDNHVYLNRLNGSGWLGWTQMPGGTLNAPALAARSGWLDVVVRGTDGGIYHNHFDGSAWWGWIQIPGGMVEAPTLVTAGTDVHLLLRGTDNGIYHNRLGPGGTTGWLGFSAAPGTTSSRPAAVAE
jgi:hypothetical protein